MIEGLLKPKILADGRVVFDSKGGEKICVVFRHFHGTKNDVGRFANDPEFRRIFLDRVLQISLEFEH